jgi:glycerol-1-phosphate dehydrogenase [NAD(P)+]
MQLPREVVIGNDTLQLIGEICRHIGFSKSALLVTGQKTLKIAGNKVEALLERDGIHVGHLVTVSCNMQDINLVEQKIDELKPQVVIGIGGGAKIDVAKIGSSHKNIPFVSIPTTAAHDGIASPLVSLKTSGKPYSITAHAPMAILADTKIIAKSPYRFTASGCGDVVAKLTAVRDWRLAHEANGEYYGEYAASLALMSAKLVLQNASVIKSEGESGLRVLIEALISCGVAMSIAGSSRPCSGSEHLFSHALDQIVPNAALHGEQCGVGAIMMARLHNMNWRKIKETLEKVGAPTTAEELKVKPEHIVEALIKTRDIRPDRYTILNERNLNRDSARKLAKATEVID